MATPPGHRTTVMAAAPPVISPLWDWARWWSAPPCRVVGGGPRRDTGTVELQESVDRARTIVAASRRIVVLPS
ncbi:MAG TPA: hypothetical protein VMQ59_05405, partial [Acidimicrobiales bacterium]|nr:hypothetical protein [Acidimicrobiales bacterium]